MDNKLIKMFEKFNRQKKLNKFYEYINENALKDEFINELFYELFRPDPNKDYTDLVNCAMAIAKGDFEPVLGEESSNRLLAMIQNNPHPNGQIMYLKQLRSWTKNQEPNGQQGVILEKVLDVFSQEGMTLGMHKIGTNIRRNTKGRGDNSFWP